MRLWKAKYSTEYDYGAGRSFENHEEHVLTEGDSLEDIENAIREVLAHGERFMGLGECTYLGIPLNSDSYGKSSIQLEACRKCNEKMRTRINKNIKARDRP